MTRESDPSRKPALLAQILEHLLDKPLASLSFRTIAKALGVSTFTLVYHFGSRAELLSDIVWAIAAREQDIQAMLGDDADSLDGYFAGLQRSWEWAIQPRNRQLQRLEFEAAMLEAQDPTSHEFTRSLFAHWLKIATDALIRFGVDEAEAEAEARLAVDAFVGIQYDLVVNADVERASVAFARLLESHRQRVEALSVSR